MNTRLWYWKPIVLLVLGIGIVGFAFWLMVTRPAPQATTNRNSSGNVRVAQPSCGNGICEDVVCLSTNCPQPETAESCPLDCGDGENAGSDTTDEGTNDNVNAGKQSEKTGTLDFRFSVQTLEEKNVCPIEEANLTPADAASIAQSAGLEQGIQAVEIRLFKDEPPLEQCVWNVKNYATTNSGNEYIMIDSTQEVLRKNTWKTGT